MQGSPREDLRPYHPLLARAAKAAWALGEGFLRVLLLNRRAPAVGGVERGIRYSFGGHRLQALDLFRPEGPGPFPVLIYVHGGAYHFGDKRTYDRVCRSFASRGCLVCNLDYRMAPRWGYPQQLQDVAAGVAWAADRAGWFGGDPRKIFLAGDSAGAWFAAEYAAAALNPRLAERVGIKSPVPSERLRGLLLFYGAFDFDSVQRTAFPFVKQFATGFLGREAAVFRARVEEASPLRHLAPGFPPCFIATSEIDPLHPESLALRDALEKMGIPYAFLCLPAAEYPYTWHGFLNFWWTGGARRAMREALAFLEEHR